MIGRTLLLLLLSAGPASAFVVPHARCTTVVKRAPPAVASAKIIPAAYTGLGLALLSRATGTSGSLRVVLASTGALATLNLATIDNSRYAGAKRASALVAGIPKGQQGLAKQWYDIVRIHLIGQVAGLVWMVRASSAVGVLRGAATFMAANVLFFLLGAAEAKHDGDGRSAPIKASLVKFILTTDVVLFMAALLGSLAPAASLGRAAGSYVFAAGCLIGAAEGAPKTATALKKLLKL